MVGSKFGEATVWGGIVLQVYIKCKYSNYYLYSKIIHISFFFANQSINSCSHVGWLCLQFHEDPFSIDTQSQCWQPFLSHQIPQKSFYMIQTWKASSHGSSLQVGIRQTGLLYGVPVLNIKTEKASFLIDWTAVTMVTEEEFASIAYLMTAAPSVDQLYCHKYW